MTKAAGARRVDIGHLAVDNALERRIRAQRGDQRDRDPDDDVGNAGTEGGKNVVK